jgi:hypothetical protein
VVEAQSVDTGGFQFHQEHGASWETQLTGCVATDETLALGLNLGYMCESLQVLATAVTITTAPELLRWPPNLALETQPQAKFPKSLFCLRN